MTQYWENWEITKSGWVDPLCQWKFDIKSIYCKNSLFTKNVQKHIGNELTMAKQRWTESSCVLCKLVQHIPIICHTKLFDQCYNKNFVISHLFRCFFKFCQLAASFVLDFFFKKFKIGWYLTKYKKSANNNLFICIWGLITKHGYWYKSFGRWVVGRLRPRYVLT